MAESIELMVEVEHFGLNAIRPSTPALDSERVVNARWEELSDVKREAALHLVREVLTDLVGRLDEWVPATFVAESHNRLDLTISIDLDDIDRAVVLRSLEVDQEVAQAMKRLREMGADLSE